MKKRILAITLTCCLCVLCGCSSVNRAMKQIEEGNTAEANRIISEKISGDMEKELDLEDSIQTYLETLYSDLNTGSVSAADAWTVIGTVDSLSAGHSAYTQKLLEGVSTLAQSKLDYENALDAIARGSYMEAYQLLGKIVAEDSNYNDALSKKNEVLNDCMRSINEEIDSATSSGDFPKAISLIDEAISIWGNNEFLYGIREYTFTQWQESNIAEARQLCQEGKFTEAQTKIMEAHTASGEEYIPEAITTENARIIEAWAESSLKEAEAAFGSNKDYQAAIQVLQNCGLENDRIDQEIQKYQDYAPKLLTDMNPTQKSDFIALNGANGQNEDMNGNKYPSQDIIYPKWITQWSRGVATTEEEGSVTYYLGAAYSELRATLYRPYCSLSIKDNEWNTSTVVKIYGDDILLYQGPSITPSTYEEYDVNVDVTGVRELRIVMLGCTYVNEEYGGSYIPMVCLGNLEIQK